MTRCHCVPKQVLCWIKLKRFFKQLGNGGDTKNKMVERRKWEYRWDPLFMFTLLDREMEKSRRKMMKIVGIDSRTRSSDLLSSVWNWISSQNSFRMNAQVCSDFHLEMISFSLSSCIINQHDGRVQAPCCERKPRAPAKGFEVVHSECSSEIGLVLMKRAKSPSKLPLAYVKGFHGA